MYHNFSNCLLACFNQNSIFKAGNLPDYMSTDTKKALLDQLKETSTRGKIAYGAACFESAIDFLKIDREKWDFMIEELWSFCYLHMVALWVERMIELLPECVLDEGAFKLKGYQYFTEEEHDALNILYKGANPVILDMIVIIYDIGLTNLNTAINTERLKMLPMPDVEALIDLMTSNNIPLPDSRLFEQFPITENHGWGREFTRTHVFGK